MEDEKTVELAIIWASKRLLANNNEVYSWIHSDIILKSKVLIATAQGQQPDKKNPGGYSPFSYAEDNNILPDSWLFLEEIIRKKKNSSIQIRRLQDICLLVNKYDIKDVVIDKEIVLESLESSDFKHIQYDDKILQSVIRIVLMDDMHCTWVPSLIFRLSPYSTNRLLFPVFKKGRNGYRFQADMKTYFEQGN